MWIRVRKFAISWAFLFALYCLLVGKLAPSEILTGGFVAGIAAIAAAAVREQSEIHYATKWSWLAHFARLPVKVLCDCFVVLAAVCRRPFLARGSGRSAEFEFNPGNDHPESKARRALVTAGVSLAPNSFVIGIDRENHRLLVHELVPARDAPDKNWPI